MEKLIKGKNKVQFSSGGDILFEAPVSFRGKVLVKGMKTKIGAFSYIRGGVIQWCESIGRYCSIAEGVRIGESAHPVDFLTTSPLTYDGFHFDWFDEMQEAYKGKRYSSELVNTIKGANTPTSIGNDVWIGSNVTIMAGVKVGDGAVIGAGAVVTKDISPYEIVGGIPAKIIRRRFDEETVNDLLDLQWWQYSAKDLAGTPWHDVKTAIKNIREKAKNNFLQPYFPEEISVKSNKIKSSQ